MIKPDFFTRVSNVISRRTTVAGFAALAIAIPASARAQEGLDHGRSSDRPHAALPLEGGTLAGEPRSAATLPPTPSGEREGELRARSRPAQEIAVEVEGCAALRPDALGEAIALELGEGGAVRPRDQAPLVVIVDAARCDGETWRARIEDAVGVVRGPMELSLASFPMESRVRITALFIAEWLAAVAPRPRAAEALAPPAPPASHAPRPPPAEPAVEAEPAPPTASELHLRVLGMISFRQIPDTPASVGGTDLGVQLAHVGELGLGVEISLGAEYGRQWDFIGLGTVRGALSSFVLFTPLEWLEVDLGVRGTVEALVDYGHHDLAANDDDPWHGWLSGFARGLWHALPALGLSLALEVEMGGSIGNVVITDGLPGPPESDEVLLEGFLFAARAGVVATAW